jgi:hypothetical protein
MKCEAKSGVCRTVTAKLRNTISSGSVFDGANGTGQRIGRATWSLLYVGATAGSATANSRRPRLKSDGARAETRFRLSAKRTSPFKPAGASVQSTTGSRGLRISGGNAGYTMF